MSRQKICHPLMLLEDTAKYIIVEKPTIMNISQQVLIFILHWNRYINLQIQCLIKLASTPEKNAACWCFWRTLPKYCWQNIVAFLFHLFHFHDPQHSKGYVNDVQWDCRWPQAAPIPWKKKIELLLNKLTFTTLLNWNLTFKRRLAILNNI